MYFISLNTVWMSDILQNTLFVPQPFTKDN